MNKWALRLIPWLVLAVGLSLAAYLVIWVGFIGGIVTFLEAVKATPISSMGVAIGIAKFVFVSILGWIIAAITLAIVDRMRW